MTRSQKALMEILTSADAYEWQVQTGSKPINSGRGTIKHTLKQNGELVLHFEDHDTIISMVDL